MLSSVCRDYRNKYPTFNSSKIAVRHFTQTHTLSLHSSPPGSKKLKTTEELYILDDDQSNASTLKGEDVQALTFRPQDLNKVNPHYSYIVLH